ncbi:epoxide hydrolase N-terminal domain-containing protein [Paenibacillus sp. CF384]
MPGTGWNYGVPLDFVKEMANYWRTAFNWRELSYTIGSLAIR